MACIVVALWLGCGAGCRDLPPRIPTAEDVYTLEFIEGRRASIGRTSSVCVLGVRTSGHSVFVDLLVDCPGANSDACWSLANAIGLRLGARETQPDWIRISPTDTPTTQLPLRRLKGEPTIELFGHPPPRVPPPVMARSEERVGWIQTVGLSVREYSLTSGASVTVKLTAKAADLFRVNYDMLEQVVVVQDLARY